jgi:type VI secretion system protein ImpH
MGAYGWGKENSVIEWLFAEGYRFDFFQAVRLLEILNSPSKPGATNDHWLDESLFDDRAVGLKDFVRFKSAVSLNFPGSDVADVRLKDDSQKLSLPESAGGQNGRMLQTIGRRMLEAHEPQGQRPLAEITVNLMGLAGALGPLDMPTTELIIERVARQDTALKDFLDIFNHRLVSLLYRIRKLHRVGMGVEPPGQDKISGYLFSVIGLGTPGLRGRMQVQDRSLLHYAGLLGQQPRSLVGLELVLAHYFGLDADDFGVKRVEGHQFVGRWCALDEEQWTRIGRSGQNQVLGRDPVVLGTRVWDQQAKVEIRLGPLSRAQFLDLLPTGWGFLSLCDLTRFYLGDTLDVCFRLVLESEQTPPPILGLRDTPRLGWTSWLWDSSLTGPPSSFTPSQRRTAATATAAAATATTGTTATTATTAARAETAATKAEVVIALRPPRAEFRSDQFPLLFHLPPLPLSQLIGRMRATCYRRNTAIVSEGDAGHSMFAIRSGRVRMTRREANGKTTTLGLLGAGDCFGETTLLIGKHREATAIALEDCVVLELDNQELYEFAQENPHWKKTWKAYRYGQFVEPRAAAKEFFM